MDLLLFFVLPKAARSFDSWKMSPNTSTCRFTRLPFSDVSSSILNELWTLIMLSRRCMWSLVAGLPTLCHYDFRPSLLSFKWPDLIQDVSNFLGIGNRWIVRNSRLPSAHKCIKHHNIHRYCSTPTPVSPSISIPISTLVWWLNCVWKLLLRPIPTYTYIPS